MTDISLPMPQGNSWPRLGKWLAWLLGLWLAFVTVTSNTFSVTVEDPPTGEHECEATGSGQCWYAAPGASGVGTEADPAEMHTIFPQMSAGDYLYLRGGTYSELHAWDAGNDWALNLEVRFHRDYGWADPQPSASEPVTIKSYTGETAVITSSYNGPCASIDTPYVTLEDVTINYCTDKGVHVGYDNANTEYVTFRNVTIHNVKYTDNSGFIYLDIVNNVTVENSTFHDYTPRDDGYSGLMIKMYKSVNIRIRNNEFYGEGGGIYYKHGSDAGVSGYTEVINNNFHDLTRRAIRTNQSGMVIKGNIIRDGSIKIHEEDGSTGTFTHDVQITYNTFVNSGINQAPPDIGSYGAGLGAKNGTVENNVFVDSWFEVWRYWTTTGSFDTGLTQNNNCYYNTGGGSQSFIYFNEGYKDFSEWNALGYDTNSTDQQDPLLQGDYSLGAGSPCDGKGHTAAVY